VSSLIELKHMSLDEIRKQLPPRLARLFNPPQNGVYRVSPRLWDAVLHVASNAASIRRRVEGFRRAIADAERPRGRVEGGLEVFERDAIASALQVWGGSSFRKKVLREAGGSVSEPTAPFLSRLKSVSVREDLQIGHDQITFPGMEVALRSVVG